VLSYPYLSLSIYSLSIHFLEIGGDKFSNSRMTNKITQISWLKENFKTLKTENSEITVQCKLCNHPSYKVKRGWRGPSSLVEHMRKHPNNSFGNFLKEKMEAPEAMQPTIVASLPGSITTLRNMKDFVVDVHRRGIPYSFFDHPSVDKFRRNVYGKINSKTMEHTF